VSEIPKGLEYNAEKEYMVRMFHVYKGYMPNQLVLQDINLDVKKGDFIVITGSNGAGKSSLIDLIAGRQSADRGEIIVNRRNLSRLKGKNLQLFRQTLGLTNHDQWVLPRESLYDNLAIIPLLHGLPEKKIHQKVSEALRMIGMKNKITFPLRNLSKGEQQLAALVRCILHEPALLLADDSTENLDPDNKLLAMRFFEQLNKKGLTIIFTTREKDFEISGDQRLIRLEKGKIVDQ
jgi:cell division transport system ATP-binding protein